MQLATVSQETEEKAGGLGFLDGSKQLLELDLVISAEPTPPVTPPSAAGTGRKGKGGKPEVKDVVIPLVVQQDLSALKGRRGDTGEIRSSCTSLK